MRNLKTLFAIGAMALFAACSAPKETTSTTTASTNRGRNNIETNPNVATKTSDGSRTARMGTASKTTIKEGRESPEAKVNYKRMYADLNMTQEQISHFEKEWRVAQSTWKRSNGEKAMNNYERVEYQDKILRDILNDSQFESYQEWVRNNANKN